MCQSLLRKWLSHMSHHNFSPTKMSIYWSPKLEYLEKLCNQCLNIQLCTLLRKVSNWKKSYRINRAFSISTIHSFWYWKVHLDIHLDFILISYKDQERKLHFFMLENLVKIAWQRKGPGIPEFLQVTACSRCTQLWFAKKVDRWL